MTHNEINASLVLALSKMNRYSTNDDIKELRIALHRMNEILHVGELLPDLIIKSRLRSSARAFGPA